MPNRKSETPLWVYVVGGAVIVALLGLYIARLNAPPSMSTSGGGEAIAPEPQDPGSAPAEGAAAAPSAEADSFGRQPGDEHYGHDHPSQGAAGAPSPSPAGGADSFGRQPGDEHYGHDHPSQGAAGAPSPSPGGAPAGGADSFGRQPGDEHYGHNHP